MTANELAHASPARYATYRALRPKLIVILALSLIAIIAVGWCKKQLDRAELAEARLQVEQGASAR